MADDPTADPDLKKEIIALVEGKTSEGEYRFSDQDLARTLPLIALEIASAHPDLRMPAALAAMLERVATEAGLDTTEDEGERVRRLEAYVKAHPPNPVLLEEIRQLLKASSGDRAAQARKLLSAFEAEGPRDLTALRPDAPRPEGTEKARPWSAFTVGDTLAKKKRNGKKKKK